MFIYIYIHVYICRYIYSKNIITPQSIQHLICKQTRAVQCKIQMQSQFCTVHSIALVCFLTWGPEIVFRESNIAKTSSIGCKSKHLLGREMLVEL